MRSFRDFAVVSFTTKPSLSTVRFSSAPQPQLTVTPSTVHVDKAFCLARHPSLDVLYLAALTEGSEIMALRPINSDNSGSGAAPGDFEVIDRIHINGASGVCRIQVDPSGHRLAAAGYLSGTASVLSLDSGGGFKNATQQLLSFSGSGPDPDRQDHPYIHDAVHDEAGLLVADLGADRVRILAVDDAGMRQEAAVICAPGSGPRHVAALGNGLVAISGELDSTLMLARVSGGAPEVLDTVPATSTDHAERNYPSNVAANAKLSLVYLANRGADTVLTASVDRAQGTLTVLAETPSGGTRPEHLALAEDHLLVVHSDNGAVTALRLVDGVPTGAVDASLTIPGAIWIEPLTRAATDRATS